MLRRINSRMTFKNDYNLGHTGSEVGAGLFNLVRIEAVDVGHIRVRQVRQDKDMELSEDLPAMLHH